MNSAPVSGGFDNGWGRVGVQCAHATSKILNETSKIDRSFRINDRYNYKMLR